MNIPFEPNQVVTLLAMFVAVLGGYFELKFAVAENGRKVTRLEIDEINRLKTEIEAIKQGATAAALLADATNRLETEVRHLRQAAVRMDRFMVRVAMKLGMEDHENERADR